MRGGKIKPDEGARREEAGRVKQARKEQDKVNKTKELGRGR